MPLSVAPIADAIRCRSGKGERSLWPRWQMTVAAENVWLLAFTLPRVERQQLSRQWRLLSFAGRDCQLWLSMHRNMSLLVALMAAAFRCGHRDGCHTICQRWSMTVAAEAALAVGVGFDEGQRTNGNTCRSRGG